MWYGDYSILHFLDNLFINHQRKYIGNTSETTIEISCDLQQDQTLISFGHETTDMIFVGIINGSSLYGVHFTPLFINKNYISFQTAETLILKVKISGMLTTIPIGGHKKMLTISVK